MSFEIDGRLHKKFDTESKTQTFQAREFVIEVNQNNYLQYIKFQLTQDRCQLIDNFEEGDQLKVHFDLRGREWNGKFFTNLNAWKIDRGTDESSIPSPPQEEGSFPSADSEPSFDDDLPF